MRGGRSVWTGWPRWTWTSIATRHQPLLALEPMARTVLATIARRLRMEGRLGGVEGLDGVGGAPCERPPLASVDVA